MVSRVYVRKVNPASGATMATYMLPLHLPTPSGIPNNSQQVMDFRLADDNFAYILIAQYNIPGGTTAFSSSYTSEMVLVRISLSPLNQVWSRAIGTGPVCSTSPLLVKDWPFRLKVNTAGDAFVSKIKGEQYASVTSCILGYRGNREIEIVKYNSSGTTIFTTLIPFTMPIGTCTCGILLPILNDPYDIVLPDNPGDDFAVITVANDNVTGSVFWTWIYYLNPGTGVVTTTIAHEPSTLSAFDVRGYDGVFGPDGSLYVTGQVTIPSLGQPQLWLAKFNPARVLAWERYQSYSTPLSMGTGAEILFDKGALYVVGSATTSPISIPTFLSNTDILAAKFDAATGSQLWYTVLAGADNKRDLGKNIRLSCNGRALYVTGTENAYVSTSPVNRHDWRLACLDAITGSILGSSLINNGDVDVPFDMELTAANEPVVCGMSKAPGSTPLPVPLTDYALGSYVVTSYDSINPGTGSTTLIPNYIDPGDYSSLNWIEGLTVKYTPVTPCSAGGGFTVLSGALTSAVYTGLNIYFPASATINAGVTVEFRDCNVLFDAGTGIEINKKGKLVVDHSLLSSCAPCGKMWNGILVHGEPTADHTTPSVHGIVEIKNNSRLENALTGVWINENALLYANDSYFDNNKVAIRFGPQLFVIAGVPFNNMSQVRNNEFRTTGYLTDPAQVDAYGRRLGTVNFIELIQVYGLFITGNRFTNVVPHFFQADVRGTGIRSQNSSYYVMEDPGTGNGNRFTDLFQGIHDIDGSYFRPIRVHQNAFEGVFRGVCLRGGNMKDVYENTFTEIPGPEVVTTGPFTGSVLNSWGVDVFSNTDCRIFSNLFSTLHNRPPFLPMPVGVVLENTWNTSAPVVFGNTFRGKMTCELNTLSNPLAQIQCNDFNDNSAIAYWDLAVTAPTGSNSTLMDQGICMFSGIPGPRSNDFAPGTPLNIVTGSLNLYACPVGCTNPSLTQIGYNYAGIFGSMNIPRNYTTALWNVPPVSCGIEPTDNCLGPIQLMPASGLPLLAAYQIAEDSVEALFDNGNTAGLLAAIQPSSSYGIAALRNLLLSASPLSDTVLLALIHRTPSLPSGHVRTILVANAPLSTRIMDALDAAPGLLSPGQRSQVELANQVLAGSYRAQLFSMLGSYEFQFRYTIGDLLRHYASVNRPDSAAWLLNMYPTVPNTCLYVPVLAPSDSATACAALCGISPTCTQVADYKLLQQTLVQLVAAGHPLSDLTSSQRSILAGISGHLTPAGQLAAVILDEIGYQPYLRSLVLPEDGMSSSKTEETLNLVVPVMQDDITAIYPNPAGDYFFVECDLFSEEANYAFSVVSLFTGQEIIHQDIHGMLDNELFISCSDWNSGIYLVRLCKNGVPVANQKLSVVR